jgi:tetratricopeptide (TPR) repeat protein
MTRQAASRAALVCCLGVLACQGQLAGPADAAGDAGAPRAPWQRLLQGADARKAAELEKRVEQLQEAEKWAEAVRAAEELLELRQKAQGKDHWEAVTARWKVEALQTVQGQGKALQKQYASLPECQRHASELEARGRYREAQSFHEKALAVHLEVLGAEHPLTAHSYNDVATNLQAQGRYAAAEERCRKALDIFRKFLGEEHPDTVGCRSNLAMSLNAQGKYKVAEEGFRKALEGCLEVHGEEHPDTARGYNNVAFNLHAQGKYAAAEEGFRKSLEIRRKVLGDEHPDTALSYNNLAANLKAQGNYAGAEEGYRNALRIYLQVVGEEHPGTARTYNNLAVNLEAQGQYAAAEQGHRRALSIRCKVLGDEHPDTASSYGNLGSTLQAQGKYAAAEEGLRKALDIKRKLLGDDNPDTANSYHNLASDLQAQGKYAAAEDGYQKALGICRKVLGEEHPHTATCYNSLAANLHEQGKYREAQDGFRKALDIKRKVLGEEHPDTARSHAWLARNLYSQGNCEAAEEGLRKALDICRKALGEEHPDTAISYGHLAELLHARGRYAAAERLWLRSADAFAKGRPRLAPSGLERATVASERSPLPYLAAVLARNGKPAAAWQGYEESLARGTWDDLSARLRRPAAERARQATLVARLDRLDQLLAQAMTIREEATQQKQREDLLGQRLQVQQELDAFVAQLEKTYGPAAGEVFDVARIQAALTDDTALLGWIDLPPGGPKAADPNGERWAFLLRARGDPVCVRLQGSGAGGAWTAEDTQLPAELRKAVQERRGAWQQLAQRLSEQRLGPLAEHLATHDRLPAVKRLVVLPSPLLAGVPVELLAADSIVSYAHSGTLFTHLRAQPKVKSQGLFALADPVFAAPTPAVTEKPLPPGGVLLTVVQPGSNAAASRLRPGDVLLTYNGKPLTMVADLAPLIAAAAGEKTVAVTIWREGSDKPLSREVGPGDLGVVLASKPAPEALKEQRRLDRRLSSRGDEWRELPGTRAEVNSLTRLFGDFPAPRVLTDTEASEQKLYELAQSGELKKYRYLHLATHGEVDDRFPLRSAVILSRDNLPDPGKQLLAGKPVFDGRLTAEEVLRQWNLDCELVTLSACQTALGKYERGEGFVGFAQALVLCGSRSVCLSLWKVDDSATALLMQRFYANLLGKRDGLKGPLPKAAALREAKEWLRNLTRAEALRVAAQVSQGLERGKGRPKLELLPPVPEVTPAAKEDRPYAHPYYWAAFVLIGDPS